MRRRVSFGCAERRTRRDKPGAGVYSLRGRYRSATAADFQWPDRQVGPPRGHLCATATGGLDTGDMLEAEFGETCEAFQTVRVDGGTRCHVLSKKPRYRAGLEVGNHPHPGATGSPTTLLDCHQHESGSPILELSTTAETGLFAANPRIINLH